MENIPNFTEQELEEIENKKARVAKLGYSQIYQKLVSSINEDQALGIVELMRSGSEKDKEVFADFLVEHYLDQELLK